MTARSQFLPVSAPCARNSARGSPRSLCQNPSSVSTGVPAVLLKIPRKLLLGWYMIAPIALAAAIIDVCLFDGSLRSRLPHSPDQLLIFAAFFNLPHIVASSVSFVDTVYLKHYRARILFPVFVLLAMLAICPSIFENLLFLAVVYFWTVIHVVGQQFGMIRLMARSPGKYLDLWKWIAVALGAPIYFGTYVSLRTIGYSDASVWRVSLLASWALLVPFAWLGCKVYAHIDTKMGKQAVLANASMIASTLVLYSLGYSFFLILIPRVVHDLSAFSFYIVHDLNRNRATAPNLIYRAFTSVGIPMWMLSPSVAMALAFPITYLFLHGVAWAFRVNVVLTLFHYYTDGFVWKNGSPQRRFIGMS
jgi:hypothetical protein